MHEEYVHARVQHIRDFPPELLAKILKWLAYRDLIRAGRVCRIWHGVIQTDPEIPQLLFKRACRSIEADPEVSMALGDPVMIHPALQIASYTMGEPLETFAIRHVSFDPNDAHCLRQQRFFLMDLEIRHDFATRPTVTQMFVKAKGSNNHNGMRKPFCAKITNPRGVTVLDVVQGIIAECRIKNTPLLTFRQDALERYGKDAYLGNLWKTAFAPDGTKIGRWLNNADMLGSLKYYHGLDAQRDGLRIHASVRLRESA